MQTVSILPHFTVQSHWQQDTSADFQREVCQFLDVENLPLPPHDTASARRSLKHTGQVAVTPRE